MNVEIRKSHRRTLAIEITPSGQVIVRAPMGISKEEINGFVKEKSVWIKQTLEKMRKKQERRLKEEVFTIEELHNLANMALNTIPLKVAHYASLVGVTYGRVTIRNQKSRWGSCSGKGNLSFNCLLMLAPEVVQDYVVVHELCHRKEMNHSARFWNEVETIMPDYKEQRRWLKEYGGDLIHRMVDK